MFLESQALEGSKGPVSGTDDLPAPSADELGELQWSRLPLMDLEDQDAPPCGATAAPVWWSTRHTTWKDPNWF